MKTPERLRLAQKALRDRLMEMGISRSMASELASGQRKPSLETAANIETTIGIPASAWTRAVPLQEMWDIIVKDAN
jgi:transcriptional regulator with XRE-family HTH domain